MSLTMVRAQTLLGEWRLNEGSGNRASDSSGNGNTGNLAAAPHNPAWAAGRLGSGLRFAGDDAVVIPSSPILEPVAVTLEAWVRHMGYPGITSVAHIAAKGGAGGSAQASYALYSHGGLNFYIGTSAGHIFSPDAGPGVWDGAWHYVVGTYDGSAVRLFVDGSEVGHGTPLSLPIIYGAVPPYEFTIGSYGDTAAFTYSYPFVGDIDEVKLWGRALSPCEINAAYRAAKASGKPGFNVLTTLREAGVFSTFIGLVEDSGLASALEQEHAVTIFAPNDKAFAALPVGTIDAYRKDLAKLRALIDTHIVRGRIAIARLADVSLPAATLTNLNGTPITNLYILCHSGGCNIGDDYVARIVRADAEAGNGFIDEIDRVMIRPIFVPL
jgi:uncharacterized surface protein with fasciclin (FAS1) repeats